MRASLSVVVLLAGTFALAAEVPKTLEGVAGYHVVRPGLATAGELSAEALARLEEHGFKTVIDLRTEKEGVKEEERIVREQGLRYVWVPVSPATLSAKDVDAVAAVLDDAAAEPILLHCASGNRAGGLLAAVLARKGKSLEEAEAEGVKAGLASDGMKEAVRRVAAPEPRP
ncbi:MAG TPA: sulfur transferase domain-containing protein [Vicinamibacteria bacterium]|nr:sulfur transferase domain-containing protein [Vicinamibacteria bacterium]